MGSRKGKPALPTVMVQVTSGRPTPAQAARWRQLWTRLLQMENAPTPGKEDRADEGGRE